MTLLPLPVIVVPLKKNCTGKNASANQLEGQLQ